LPGHEYFCEVTEDFIEDDFNLTGLNAMVPFWKEAMEMVLDVEPGVGFLCTLISLITAYSDAIDEDASKIPDVSIVESSAEMLYGLVHQRYILTRAGLQLMVLYSTVISTQNATLTGIIRSINTKMACLDLVHASIALDAMSSRAGALICQV
jgi:hypothetical protein